MNLQEFQKTLEAQVREVCSECGWKYDAQNERGYAFQLWFARLLKQYDPALETDPEDSLLKSRDLRIDILLDDSDRQNQYLVQCKFTGTSRKTRQKDVSEADVAAFYDRHTPLMDRGWVREHASSEALELLANYADRVNQGWRSSYYFVCTSNASDRVRALAEQKNRAYASMSLDITCVLLDLSSLKDFYLNAQSLDQTIPDVIEVDLPSGLRFERKEPYPTLIACVKGNWLRNLYQKHRESLFAWNIRGYLGNRGLNKTMADTADTHPEDFFYYNNGISAICTDCKSSPACNGRRR
jgi:hypothetical protein